MSTMSVHLVHIHTDTGRIVIHMRGHACLQSLPWGGGNRANPIHIMIFRISRERPCLKEKVLNYFSLTLNTLPHAANDHGSPRKKVHCAGEMAQSGHAHYTSAGTWCWFLCKDWHWLLPKPQFWGRCEYLWGFLASPPKHSRWGVNLR